MLFLFAIGATAQTNYGALPQLFPTNPSGFSYASPNLCGQLSDMYGLIPAVSTGTAPNDVIAQFAAACPSQLCYYWMAKHQMVLGSTWGTAPQPVQKSFSDPSMNCHGVVSKYLGPQPTCAQIYEAFNIVPVVTYGTSPDYYKKVWDASQCSQTICQYWKDKYRIVVGQSWGSAPADVQQSWSSPQMNCRTKVH